MLGFNVVLMGIGTWLAIAPVVAIVVGRALKAADPYAGYELAAGAAELPRAVARPRPVTTAPRRGPSTRPAIVT